MRRRRLEPVAVLDALSDVRDGLRGRLSLRDAVVRAGRRPGSVLRALVPELASGTPIVAALTRAARTTPSAELSLALLVLAVSARAGGDPLPSVAAVTERLRRRTAGEREARAITTQARLTARALLLLTPGFAGLVALLDPRGFVHSLGSPAVRIGLGAGIVLQVAGGWWVSRIMAAPVATVPSRMRRLPLVRAVARVAVGPSDEAGRVAGQVAHAADAMALVIDAGMAPAQAVGAVARAIPAPTGDALRAVAAACHAGVPLKDALRRSVRDLPGTAPHRLGHAIASSVRLGVPLARTLRTLSDELRETEASRVEEAVRAASVRVLVPVALCILPAFVLAGLVPLLLTGLEGISL